MATKVVGYVRVSTEQQAGSGLSLDAQRAKLAAYATAMDLELVTIEVDEGLSARTISGRPGLQRALAALEAGEADGLLVAKLDRLTRSLRDLGDMLDRYFAKRFALLSLGDSIDTRTAGGRLVLNVLTSVAQWEREAGTERTKDALAQVRKEGGRFGRAPYGWRYAAQDDEHGRRPLEAHPEEQEVMRAVRQLRAEGETQAGIVEALRMRGYRSRVGNFFGMTQVARIAGTRQG